jgi:NADPH-dependent 2,4-dienoyl-CoA reductase/sulfur reductase-like enzyme
VVSYNWSRPSRAVEVLKRILIFYTLRYSDKTLCWGDVAPKCPIVSGKAPLLIDSYLENVRMLRGRCKIVVATPLDHLHAQPEINKVLEEKLKDQGIEYVYNFEPAQVDARNKKEVVSTKGEKLKYDLFSQFRHIEALRLLAIQA